MTDGYVTSIVATQYIAGLVIGAGCLPSFGLLGSLRHDGFPGAFSSLVMHFIPFVYLFAVISSKDMQMV